tara:strand:+ start:1287 stop:1484 length:198 start_codon:yes stop_codon:yes gene_type:complete
MEVVERALKVAGSFPGSREAPKLLLSLFKEAKGLDRDKIGELVEVLYASAETEDDLNLVNEYWAS